MRPTCSGSTSVRSLTPSSIPLPDPDRVRTDDEAAGRGHVDGGAEPEPLAGLAVSADGVVGEQAGGALHDAGRKGSGERDAADRGSVAARSSGASRA